MYDSENDEDYIAACSSSSDEDDEFDAIASTSTRRGRLPSQRMRTSTPSLVSPFAPSTSDSTSAPSCPSCCKTVLLGPRRMCCLTMKPLNLYLRLCKTPSL
ncbi:hypothetical protein Avbf_12500 [Armadillidium vulgare]|nr:hypothetical protein Avbf_12500 [Armadillidium vulgare]